jgi:AraC family transcriptional regulator
LIRAPEGDLLRARAGDVLLVAVGREYELCGRPSPAEVLVARLPLEWSRDALARAGGGDSARALSCALERAGTDAARRASRLVRELAITSQSRSPSARLRTAALGLELLALATEGRGGPPEVAVRRGSRKRRDFLAAVAALESAPLDGVSLPVFARGVGLSERQVARLFRDELGKTFREHLVELRIERAKGLLRGTSQSVIAIAGESGWSSLAHFNAVFRRRVGTTPSAYRGVRGRPVSPSLATLRTRSSTQASSDPVPA